MNGQPQVFKVLNSLNIAFEYHEHPPVPTVREAAIYWKDLNATHCKNLFFRNHKGNKHYLVVLEYSQNVVIKDLEQRLRQGKITFASDERLARYLKLTAGSVSPFGLINDSDNHVHVFFDENLLKAQRISFHPNLNTASLIVAFNDFIRYMDWTQNSYEFIKLYD